MTAAEAKRVGVVIAGSNGAVATTVIAGAILMRKGLVPRHGMLTESASCAGLPLAAIDDLVFGGWDLRADNAYQAALDHGVVPERMLDQVKAELEQIVPWPAVASSRYLASMAGKHMVGVATVREELELISANIEAFKLRHGLARVVMVNLTSTERYIEIEDCHRTIPAFEAALDANDPRISPAMKYLYVACQLGIPHANFTPSLSKVPALEKLAEQRGVPIAGEDGKTGQTMLKTVLAPAFVIRQLQVDGWYSTNILGNNDGLVLDDPGSNKTKVVSKSKVLDDILGYSIANHQVHIDYYRPRGDAKEAWDSIDLIGFLGERMQLKVDFMCKDSILAAPIVFDLVRLLDLAKRHKERGIQRQMSVFFKAPYHTEGERPMHDLFKQHAMLENWLKQLARKDGVVTASANGANGATDRAALG
jgi:myo-inositol-1-phosphate synthase